MRKITLLLLVLLLTLAGFSSAFAEGITVPTDVKGTIYEDAVKVLMEKGVITGYPDGTYRSGDSISRAEACVIVVKSMGITDKELISEAKNSFPDLTGHAWAVKYINYAAAKGVIVGYPDGTFRPDKEVTYNEMAAMLVSALGYKVKDLEGTWPDNFILKAEELGIFSGFHYVVNAHALRGHVALMDYSVVDKIAEANKPVDTTEPDTNPAGPLVDFSGRAYGLILDKAIVLNADKDPVEQLEFLFGKQILFVNTNGKFEVDMTALDNSLKKGDLFGLQMNDGIVRKIGDSATGFAAIGSPSGYEDFTLGSWKEVESIKNAVVTIKIDDATVSVKSILDDASIYIATYDRDDNIDGYKPGTLRDIKAGNDVRLYSVTGKNPGVVEIVVVSEPKI